MNLILDNRTLTITQVAVSIILFAAMLIGLYTQKTYPGFGRWTLAKLPNALGWALFSLRGLIPDWLSIVIGNGLLLISPIFSYEGIRQFRGKPHRDVFNYVLLALLLGGLVYFTWEDPNVNIRLALVVASGAVVFARCAFELLHHAPHNLRFSYWFTGAMFAIYDVILLLRVITLGSLPSLLNPFEVDLWQNILYLATDVVGIGWTFGFFMLTNHRLALELRTAQVELREMATTDSLTGALNRRAFVEKSQHEIARSHRYGYPLALLIMDIDHFKKFNDTYGHISGDTFLREMVKTCHSQLREIDILARWGGEEFVVLLPDTDSAACLQVAERLRNAVSDLSIQTPAGYVKTTISAGCAFLKPEDKNLDMILQRADMALYQAKRDGRNRVKSG